MNTALTYNINPLVSAIGKMPDEFTKDDIINFITANDIRVVNFRYIAGDGRLKTLNFPVSSLQYLDLILSFGERVDGSSLFSYIEAGSSDLYVIPRFSTAYIDPFAEIPTLGMLCSYFTKDGLPLESSPEYTLRKAHEEFKKTTGYTFEAMGELEFYVIYDDDNCFPSENQRGYHESTPFTKVEAFRTEAMKLISQVGGNIKYAHSEVGNFTLDGKVYEQNEIEFLVSPVESAADQLVMAKWILRTLAWQYGFDITFAPKITEGKAGSGLHFHTRIMNGEHSVMLKDGRLSDEARKAIAGYMTCASSLTDLRFIPDRLRQCQPYIVLPPRASSGGSHQHLLGRPQPFRTGTCTPRMDRQERYVRHRQRTAPESRHRDARQADRRASFR